MALMATTEATKGMEVIMGSVATALMATTKTIKEMDMAMTMSLGMVASPIGLIPLPTTMTLSLDLATTSTTIDMVMNSTKQVAASTSHTMNMARAVADTAREVTIALMATDL